MITTPIRKKLDKWIAHTTETPEGMARALKLDRTTHDEVVAYVRRARGL